MDVRWFAEQLLEHSLTEAGWSDWVITWEVGKPSLGAHCFNVKSATMSIRFIIVGDYITIYRKPSAENCLAERFYLTKPNSIKKLIEFFKKCK